MHSRFAARRTTWFECTSRVVFAWTINHAQAPEILRAMPYTYAVDFWSLGVIVFEMLIGKVET